MIFKKKKEKLCQSSSFPAHLTVVQSTSPIPIISVHKKHYHGKNIKPNHQAQQLMLVIVLMMKPQLGLMMMIMAVVVDSARKVVLNFWWVLKPERQPLKIINHIFGKNRKNS